MPDFTFTRTVSSQVFPGRPIFVTFSVVNWPSVSSGNAATMSPWLGASLALTAACAPGADTRTRAAAEIRPAMDEDVRIMGSPA